MAFPSHTPAVPCLNTRSCRSESCEALTNPKHFGKPRQIPYSPGWITIVIPSALHHKISSFFSKKKIAYVIKKHFLLNNYCITALKTTTQRDRWPFRKTRDRQLFLTKAIDRGHCSSFLLICRAVLLGYQTTTRTKSPVFMNPEIRNKRGEQPDKTRHRLEALGSRPRPASTAVRSGAVTPSRVRSGVPPGTAHSQLDLTPIVQIKNYCHSDAQGAQSPSSHPSARTR